MTLLQLVAALERAADRRALRQFELPPAGDIRESRMLPARLVEIAGERPSTTLAQGLAALLRAE